MHQETMLAKIEDVLTHGRPGDAPAYTLVLGAGASFGIVPTAKEMLGFPDARTKQVHEKSIPVWLAAERGAAPTPEHREGRCKEFWSNFRQRNAGNDRCSAIQFADDGLPKPSSIAAAYQAVFETACVGGLDTPEKHLRYLRAVTMDGTSATRLNATHFYLASLLSLQRSSQQVGSSRELLYRGKREFARTIFTTNFDPLLQTSLQLFQQLYYMTDRPELLAADALYTDATPSIHLFYAHGSVHRPFLANTDEQIALLKRQNANALTGYLANHGVIVLGYSGWDDCLLQALNQTKTFSNNLYWLARSGDSISDSVMEFLKGHPNAYWVEIEDGGSVMAALHNRLCPGAPNSELLYNPIRPLLSQLSSVNLEGIASGGGQRLGSQGDGNPASHGDARLSGSMSGAPQQVEVIRLQVIARLEDAQKLFAATADARGGWEEQERQAALSYANKDWGSALISYERLLDFGPEVPIGNRALAIFRCGYCRAQKGDLDQAIADFTAVIEMPGAPVEQVAKARVNRGFRRGEKGETDQAIADFSVVIEMPGAPVDSVAWARVNRAISWGQKGDTDREIADYSAVIEMPGAPVEQVANARVNRGICWGQKGDTDREIVDYSAVIEMPDAPIAPVAVARVNRGICWGQKGDTEQEIADYSAVIHMPGAPVDEIARARVNRGNRWAQKGDTDQAIADYTAIIDMSGAPADHVSEAYRVLKALRRPS